MPGGILLRCVGHKETQRNLEEVHNKTCGFYGEVSLYQRLQKASFYWPNMGKDADLIQSQCKAYHLVKEREESYAVFTTEDQRSLFIGYLIKYVLPQKHGGRYKLRKLASRYFLRKGTLFKKGYDGDPLRCLGPKKASKMLKEMHIGECEDHLGRKKLYRCILQMGYYWPTMRRDATEFVRKCHGWQM